jgi:hypothetical protein
MVDAIGIDGWELVCTNRNVPMPAKKEGTVADAFQRLQNNSVSVQPEDLQGIL